MTPRHLKVTFLTLCVAALVAGCGSSDSSSDSSAETVTKVVFIRQADAVCKKADKEQEDLVGKLGKQTEKTGKAADDAELIEKAGLPPLKQEIEELNEMPLPEDGGKAAAVISEMEAALKQAEADPTSLVSERPPFAKAEAKARAYGLKVCGGP